MSLKGTVEYRKAFWDESGQGIPEERFVRYESYMDSEPTKVITRWKIISTQGWIEDGMEIHWNSNDPWHGYSGIRGYTKIWTDKNGENTLEPVPCPKVKKGTETHWKNGRWEKLLKSGWVLA